MRDRNILFVINPKAGRRRGTELQPLIARALPAGLRHRIVMWENREQASAIVDDARSGAYSEVIAVGGDGTVNMLASAVVNTETALGIIPSGSGNGLARSLGISMETDRAIAQVVEGKITRIDAGTVNGIPFFCTSGIGFDAHIGNLFAASLRRGLRSYISITTRELIRYRAGNYTLKIGGETFTRNAFLITVANAGQYGNDFYIAPTASMQDGLFHVVVIKPFNILKVGPMLGKILAKKANLSNSIETLTASELTIETAAPAYFHFDGEPGAMISRLEYRMFPRALKVIHGSGQWND